MRVIRVTLLLLGGFFFVELVFLAGIDENEARKRHGGQLTEAVDSILEAFLPAQMGGTAIAATLSGASAPAGRMPYTVPVYDEDIPPIVNYDMNATISGRWLGRTYRYAQPAPQWPFGYGLSYAQWTYTDIKLSTGSISTCDSITVTFAVRNTGVIVSDEVPQLYLEWETGTGDTNWPELRGFTRLHAVPAGSSKSVTMLLTSEARAVVRGDGVRVLRPGKFTVHVGGGQPLIDPRFHTSNILSAPVFVTGTEIEANTCDKY